MRDTSTSRGNRLVKKPALRFALLALTFSAAFNCVETADARLPQNLISTFNPIPQGHTGDRFGSAIAVNEETVVVGLPGHDSISGLDTGAVQVFYGTATPGFFNCVQILQTIGGVLLPAPADNCGNCVAISPNWIVAGSPNWDNPGPPIIYNAGAVFIWRKIAPNLWETIAKGVLHDNKFEQDRFGTSVTLHEDVNGVILAVGTPTDGLGNGNTSGAYVNRGSVSLYKYNNQTLEWEQNGFIPAFPISQQTNLNMANGFFGVSIAIFGDYMVIGAHRQSVTKSRQGTAFVFKRGGVFVPQNPDNQNQLWGEWKFVQRLVSQNPKIDDQFGWVVGITPWNIIVGAPAGIAPESINEIGSASIWRLDPLDLIEPAKDPSTFSDGFPGDQFGYSVLIESATVQIGAVGFDTPSNQNTGCVYQFKRFSTACSLWTQETPILPPPSANIANSRFGTSLALATNCILVSSLHGANQVPDQGVVFSFMIPQPPEPCETDFNGDGGTDGEDLLLLLSHWGGPGGDVNGDGTTNGADLTYAFHIWGPCVCGD